MQIVSIGDNLHECQILFFFSRKKKEKYFNMSSAENFTQITQSAKWCPNI